MVATQSRRDILIGTFLSVATAAFVLWQNTRVAVLWDLSYLLDSSWRFALGQPMYRELPFAHPPLTFLIQAFLIRLTGRVYWHHIAYACAAGAAATLFTWRILLHLLRTRIARPEVFALLLALPLIPLGIASIYPHPIYDSDAILSVLFALSCLFRIHTNTRFAWCFLTGAALVAPLFFKQNIGLLFLATTVVAILAVALGKQAHRRPWRSEFSMLLGALTTFAVALFTIHFTAGIANYLHWTITFAAQRRLPGLNVILGSYAQSSLLWTVPTAALGLLLLDRFPGRRWSGCAALFLLALPFLVTLVTLPFLNDVSDRTDQLLSLWPHLLVLSIAFALYQLLSLRCHLLTLATLLPFILLATIHGTFLSQQLWGSTYALWPLLMLLIACLLPFVRRVALPLTAILSVTLVVCGSAYALSLDRLSYIHLEGPRRASNTPALAGLTTHGEWLPQLDELIQDTNATIPATDTILLYPGEDPFFYATGRTPHFPILLFDPATDPYSPTQLAQAVVDKNIRWLILNRDLQLTEYAEPNHADYLTALTPLFTFDHSLTGYDIYRRK